MKKVMVISLGGSQILNNGEINVAYLKKFKSIMKKYSRKYKFIIVTGGGSVARTYINGLRKIKANDKLQSFAGISVTRTNARFMSYFFGSDLLEGVPTSTKELKKLVKKQSVVITGALEYHPDQTSDSTAAQIAREFKAEFINITNVNGLYTSNPKKNKNAKHITDISWKDFNDIARKIPFSAGQHFVLDQKASRIIKASKIKTYIVGPNIKDLDNLLAGKKFVGTTIFN